MLYNIRRNNYKDFKIMSDNRLKARSYFIPFSDEDKCRQSNIIEKRYSSDRVICLNGDWDFLYFCKMDDVPRNLDTDTQGFDSVKVPSCWQFTGYEPPFYTNVIYPFNPKPPKVPVGSCEGTYGDDINGYSYKVGKKQYNSIGLYRKKITISDLSKNYILSFLGVSSSSELYCNGKYVGYGEGSHNTAEYDITSYLVCGENEIVVVVHKWCTGSYLEDQDMFRNNGIFRDVLLYVYEKSYIFDIDFFTTKNNSGTYDTIVSADIVNPENTKISATLRYKGKIIESRISEANQTTKIMFPNLEVKEWSAEIPNLYELTINLIVQGNVIESIIKNVGFKSIKIAGRIMLLNGKNIKIMGVNHHDTHPERGYCLTAKEIEKDILLCKNYNVNAIRTSHYPPDPLMTELADLYGIYLIEEADIETHGLYNPREISNNLRWKDHLWDRVERMYYRDRNSPSIIIWSLGNESSGIRCQDYCYKKLKELTLLPILYERACHSIRGAYDIGATMYPSVMQLKKVAGNSISSGINPKTYSNKPFLMVEYAHAMGVSAGNLKEYWDVIWENDCLLGGCIWEMVDHAVKHGDDAKYKYTYGGDHGEYLHDGNFCVDGLFFPDRTPHTGAHQMKNVYRPIRAKLLEPGVIELKNLNSFRNSDYLSIKGLVLIEGEKSFEFELPSDIDPGKSRKYDLNYKTYDGDCCIQIEYFDRDRFVGRDQLVIGESKTKIPNLRKSEITVNYAGNIVNVNFGSGNIRFDKTTAAVVGYSVQGKELLVNKPLRDNEGLGRIYHNIFRAPMDNDVNIKRKWLRKGYDDTAKTEVIYSDNLNYDSKSIIFDYKLVSKNKKLFNVKDIYEISSGGIVRLYSEMTPATRLLPELPRVGKIVEMGREYNEVAYYGNGPYESYPDYKEHVKLGVFSKSAKDFLEPYIRPQESGNRTDVRYISIKNDKGSGIMFIADKDFLNVGVKTIRDQELAKCRHREDIVDSDTVYVSVDGFMAGIGSNSCGPKTMPEYRLQADKKYTMSFVMVPFTDVASTYETKD